MKETVTLYQQCKAPNGETGSFLADHNRGKLVSPVFTDTYGLFQWCRANGWEAAPWSTLSQAEYVRVLTPCQECGNPSYGGLHDSCKGFREWIERGGTLD